MKVPFPTPEIRLGSLQDRRCHPSKEKDMAKIDLPGQRRADWKEVMLKKMAEVLEKYRSVRLFMDICVRCGACADKCQFFLGSGDPKNMPVARADLFRKVYKRYFTLGGKIWGRANEAEELTDSVLEDWYTYFYQCSECRRCSVFCPYGIDTAEITMAAREIMAAAGIATKYVTEVVAKVYDTGNNLGIWAPAWKDNCSFLEEDLKDTEGLDIKFPVDAVGADVLLVPPSADNFVNTNTMIGYAKMFHAAGISWTTSTYCNEGRQLRALFELRQFEEDQQPDPGGGTGSESEKNLLGRVRARLEGRSGLHPDPERSHGLSGDPLSGAHLRPHLGPDLQGGFQDRQDRRTTRSG